MNAFDWKDKPSEILKSLKRTETGQKNSRGNKPVSTEKRRFHQYSLAQPYEVSETSVHQVKKAPKAGVKS